MRECAQFVAEVVEPWCLARQKEVACLDLAELRALQDFTVRPSLQAVAGVAEVASLGGFERQYQIVVDPDRLVGFGLTMTAGFIAFALAAGWLMRLFPL